MMPAAGQGAIGIEICADRPDLAQILSPLNDTPTAIAVYAERGVSRTMGGSCSMPLAAHATLNNGVLSIVAAWGDPMNSHAPLIEASAQCSLDAQNANALEVATQLGIQVAQKLMAKGAVGV
jgi:hydroxymethylbilane synthase